MSVKAGWKNPGVIENNQIILAQQAGKVPEAKIAEGPGPSIEVQQAGGSTIRESFLGNKVFGKMVVEVGDQHSV